MDPHDLAGHSLLVEAMESLRRGHRDATMGMRSGELSDPTRQDVELIKRGLAARRALQRRSEAGLGFGEPKSGR